MLPISAHQNFREAYLCRSMRIVNHKQRIEQVDAVGQVEWRVSVTVHHKWMLHRTRQRTIKVVLCKVEVQDVATAAHDAVPWAVCTWVSNQPVCVLYPFRSARRVVESHQRVPFGLRQ